MKTEVKHGYVGANAKPMQNIVQFGTPYTGTWAGFHRFSLTRYKFAILTGAIGNHHTLVSVYFCPNRTEVQRVVRYPLHRQGTRELYRLAAGVFRSAGPIEPLLDALMTEFPETEPVINKFLMEVV